MTKRQRQVAAVLLLDLTHNPLLQAPCSLTRVRQDHVGTQKDACWVPWLASGWRAGEQASQQWRTAAGSDTFVGHTSLQACQQGLHQAT